MEERHGGLGAKAALALATGSLYLLMGSLLVVAGLGFDSWLVEALGLDGAVMDGFALIVVGAVFIQGHQELSRGLHEGVAFVYMGILLALFFLVVEVSQISASYLGAWMVGGEWEGYSLWDTASPALYLSPLPLAGLLAWRRGFTLDPRTVDVNTNAFIDMKEG